MKKIKLSVCVSTYNQVDFISECLDSLLNQITSFNYEVLVSDDCSTDGTSSIVEMYCAKYPEKIKNVSRVSNGGPFVNYLNVHQSATGEFVAHMDGDDIALPGKLEAQVLFLDNNPKCNVVWHRMVLFDKSVEIIHASSNIEFVERPIYAEEASLLGPMGAHSSTMYRRKNFNINKFTNKCDDWLMAIFYLENGYAYMLDAVLGKYRITSTSMSGGSRANKKNRELSTSSQLMAVQFNSKLAPFVATRALANFVLDAFLLRSYCLLSLKVLIKCRSFPLLLSAPKIYRFYMWSRRPSVLH